MIPGAILRFTIGPMVALRSNSTLASVFNDLWLLAFKITLINSDTVVLVSIKIVVVSSTDTTDRVTS